MSNELVNLRHQIDGVDQRILELLALRYDILSIVAQYKERHAVPARIPARIKSVIDDREARAAGLGLPPGAVRAIWNVIVEEACRYEESCLSKENSRVEEPAQPEG